MTAGQRRDSQILFLVPDLCSQQTSGIGRHARVVCRALADLGFDVQALALLDPPDAGSGCLPDRVTYRRFSGDRRAFTLAALAGARRHPCLVLVEHLSFAHLGWLAARLARAPLAVFGHGVEIWRPLPLLRRVALRRAGRVICVSHDTADRAAAVNRLRSDRVRVLHNCLDPSFPLPPVRPPGPRPPSLLTVGRMSLEERYKGHNAILRALPALLARFPDLRYDIVGDGDGRPELEALARTLGVAPAVTFHGVVSEPVLSSLYAAATAFVMPSRGEGFGLVFLEAMACGLPVIAAKGGAAAEIILDRRTGFLLDPSSIDELVFCASRLLEDRELRNRMGCDAAEHVRASFTFPPYRDRLSALLAEVGVKAE